MKTIILIFAAIFSMSCANAQKIKEIQVPEPVKSKFHSLYPKADEIEWEKEDADYEVEFENNHIESSLLIDALGNVKETETEMKTGDLPKVVTDYVSKNYAGYKIDEAAKITDTSGNIMYEAEMKKGKEKFDLVFGSNGDFIKKVIKNKDSKN